MKRKSLL